MKRIYIDYIQDILSSLYEINDFTKGINFATFTKDKKTINAVIQSLRVMGEAVKSVPNEIKDKYPEIPWKNIAGMRDKLVHKYYSVDLEIVWTVIQKEIPPLIPVFKKILSEIEIDEVL